jgi:hypothetical protein
MHDDLVLSKSVPRRVKSCSRKMTRANSWDCLFCLMIVNLRAAYSYKIEAFNM